MTRGPRDVLAGGRFGILPDELGLVTDFYELTMAQGYFASGIAEQRAVFDLFFRRAPFGGEYAVMAGLDDALAFLEGLRFGRAALDYLAGLGSFDAEFMRYLGRLRFEGDVYAVPEGRVVFPREPLLRVEAPLVQAQLAESALLNLINFQTLIATKAARVVQVAGGGRLLEFGLRRAQGFDGGLSATRAAYIGGADSTSNVLAGERFGIPVVGTQAHSWIMAFPDELTAFRAYARAFPDGCLLLVDTYDTLRSGVPNAITVGRELAAAGHRLLGIRLDSGDLTVLSREARRMLDEAGLQDARIAASSELDEHLIRDIRTQGARIDLWGVGTHLVTAQDQPALGGVYKLVAIERDDRLVPLIKVSNNVDKVTDPGVKRVERCLGPGGELLGDVIALAGEDLGPPDAALTLVHPTLLLQQAVIRPAGRTPLLEPQMRGGCRLAAPPSFDELRRRCRDDLSRLAEVHRRFLNPEPYRAWLSPGLAQLKRRLLEEV